MQHKELPLPKDTGVTFVNTILDNYFSVFKFGAFQELTKHIVYSVLHNYIGNHMRVMYCHIIGCNYVVELVIKKLIVKERLSTSN